jgi:hypothetical protein
MERTIRTGGKFEGKRGWGMFGNPFFLRARLFQEYDNVTLLVSRLRLPVRFGDLVQRMAFIDHCP